MDTVEEQQPAAAPAATEKLNLVESAKQARRWQTELNASKKWMEKFTTAAHKCEKAYFGTDSGTEDSTYAGRTNLFWSNVQVVMSAIYGRLPKAEVSRKFKDYDDDVARVAAQIMQRILNGDIEREWDDTNAALRDATADRFVVGMGQVWCRYEAEFETVPQAVIDPTTGMAQVDAAGDPVMQDVDSIVCEEAEVEYVYWADFRYSPCRRWRECRWVARRVYMPEAKLKERFNLSDEQASAIPMTTRTHATDDGGQEDVLKATPFKQAAVWEIWSRDDNYVCWYVEGCSYVLDQKADPLELDDFFPCPQPIVSSTLTKAFLPRSDYAMVQDLYKELDRVNARICALTDAVRATGVYDKTAAALRNLLTNKTQNQLIPVDNWSHFIEKGGMKGSVDWLPIDQFVNAIVQLNSRKSQLQHDLYEVLGISDIMRGASVASETATAQTLKVQYGGARLSNMQNEVARFVSEVMRIRANIIANVFQPQTILQRSQIERTPDAQLAQPALQMLKNFGVAMYSIKVTADTLAAPDWAQEKEARTEFLGAASNYLMAVGPMVQQTPAAGGFLVKLLQWAAAGFKGAETIEGVLDQAARQLEQSAAQPAEPKQPSPEDTKNLASADKSKADAERTRKETALIPPIQIGPQGPPGGMPPGIPFGGGGAGPGGPPGGPGMPMQTHPVPAGPGTVPPMAPQMPAPFNPGA